MIEPNGGVAVPSAEAPVGSTNMTCAVTVLNTDMYAEVMHFNIFSASGVWHSITVSGELFWIGTVTGVDFAFSTVVSTSNWNAGDALDPCPGVLKETGTVTVPPSHGPGAGTMGGAGGIHALTPPFTQGKPDNDHNGYHVDHACFKHTLKLDVKARSQGVYSPRNT